MRTLSEMRVELNGNVMTIHIYSNIDGRRVDAYEADTNAQCETWALETYGDEEYHWSYCEVPVSNAIEVKAQ